MTMHLTLHPRFDIDRRYESRKERRRGIASTWDRENASIQNSRTISGISKKN